jgi:hypothetical protein
MQGMPFKRVDDAKRAQAIAMYAAGATLGAISRETGIAATTVGRWIASPQGRNAVVATSRHAVELNLGQRIAELLNANIEAVTVLARQFSDPRWVASQSASDLIAVYNAVGDRTIQILASVQPATDGGGSGEQPAPGAGELAGRDDSRA